MRPEFINAALKINDYHVVIGLPRDSVAGVVKRAVALRYRSLSRVPSRANRCGGGTWFQTMLVDELADQLGRQ